MQLRGLSFFLRRDFLMWFAQTSSRLHLGLFSLPEAGMCWLDYQGRPLIPARRFGGVGLMIRDPGIHLEVHPADNWQFTGPLSGRIESFVHRILRAIRQNNPEADLPARHITVTQASREHVGLGTGTQLGLATAAVLAHSWGRKVSSATLANWVGRGERSALGVYGFERGGFLIDGGKTEESISPLLMRLSFPEIWRVILIIPKETLGVHGPKETMAFEQVRTSQAETDALCRLVLLGMVPALLQKDIIQFGKCVWDFNARVGSLFSAIQQGIYASPRVATLIGELRRMGIMGVGQSSWGPGVFGIVRDEEEANHTRKQLEIRGFAEKDEIVITNGVNEGATVR